MGRPDQRPDDARRISIWEGADECWFDEVYARIMIATVIDTGVFIRTDDDRYLFR